MNDIIPVKVSSIEEVKKLDKELNHENDNYIVYYNKFDGTTEKLYVGNNETKAVNIFWTKFLDEVYRSNDIIKEKIPQKFINNNHPSEKKSNYKKCTYFYCLYCWNCSMYRISRNFKVT